ncbi:MAG TPA: alpha/beta hydrolase [Smithellaceae bacterium]|nr:alpha/beta hydrolase [Smithellaceae bacterium]
MYLELSDGATIGCELTGEGETIIFIPGILGNTRTFDGMLKYINGSYRCLSVEYAGQGKTRIAGRKEKEQYAVAGHVGDLQRLLKYLKIDKCHIVGLSFGSLLAVELAARMAGKAKSLVLLSSLICNDTAHYKNWAQFWSDCSSDADRLTKIGIGLLFSEKYLQAHPDQYTQLKEIYSQLSPENLLAFRHNLKTGPEYDIKNTFSRLQCPVRIIHGEEDIIHPVWELRAWLKQTGKSSLLHALPDTAHALHVEQPELIAREMRQFWISKQ